MSSEVLVIQLSVDLKYDSKHDYFIWLPLLCGSQVWDSSEYQRHVLSVGEERMVVSVDIGCNGFLYDAKFD